MSFAQKWNKGMAGCPLGMCMAAAANSLSFTLTIPMLFSSHELASKWVGICPCAFLLVANLFSEWAKMKAYTKHISFQRAHGHATVSQS